MKYGGFMSVQTSTTNTLATFGTTWVSPNKKSDKYSKIECKINSGGIGDKYDHIEITMLTQSKIGHFFSELLKPIFGGDLFVTKEPPQDVTVEKLDQANLFARTISPETDHPGVADKEKDSGSISIQEKLMKCFNEKLNNRDSDNLNTLMIIRKSITSMVHDSLHKQVQTISKDVVSPALGISPAATNSATSKEPSVAAPQTPKVEPKPEPSKTMRMGIREIDPKDKPIYDDFLKAWDRLLLFENKEFDVIDSAEELQQGYSQAYKHARELNHKIFSPQSLKDMEPSQAPSKEDVQKSTQEMNQILDKILRNITSEELINHLAGHQLRIIFPDIYSGASKQVYVQSNPSSNKPVEITRSGAPSASQKEVSFDTDMTPIPGRYPDAWVVAKLKKLIDARDKCLKIDGLYPYDVILTKDKLNRIEDAWRGQAGDSWDASTEGNAVDEFLKSYEQLQKLGDKTSGLRIFLGDVSESGRKHLELEQAAKDIMTKEYTIDGLRRITQQMKEFIELNKSGAAPA